MNRVARKGPPLLSIPQKAVTERRYLAVLFADLTASTEIVQALDPEDYSYLTATLRVIFDHVIPRHGGTIVQVMGDGVMASFGYPEASEDDGRRAVEAALELHETVRSLRLGIPTPYPLRMHTGIHAGLVLLSEGDEVSGTLKLVGPPVNVAARLSGEADVDEIMVSTQTLGVDRHLFETDEERRFSLRGVEEPVAAFRVVGRAEVDTRFEARERGGLTPFVARFAELDTMMATLRETLAGAATFLSVTAPPGLGKTRLAHEFLRQAEPLGVRILRGYCEGYLGAEPVQPLLQMLRDLAGIAPAMDRGRAAQVLAARFAEIDPALSDDTDAFLRALSLQDSDTRGSGAGRAILDPARRLFASLAARSPLVVFVDDWQWADDVTRELFGTLNRLDARIMVLVTSREDPERDLGLSPTRTLHLAPLSEGDVDRTISHLLPEANDFLLEQIRSLAGGNPLYAEELCRASTMVQSRRIEPTLGSDAWLGVLIVARVEHLSPQEARVVRTAAVLGTAFPADLLETLTGHGADDPVLAALERHDLIHPDGRPGRLRFKHGIAREVIYDSVGLHERRALHLRVAELLRASARDGMEDEVVEALAYHYQAGNDFENAATYAEMAGNKAVAASALDRARTQYSAALRAIDAMGAQGANYARWMTVVRRLSSLCVFDPSPEQLPFLERAVTLARGAEDAPGEAAALYWLGYVHYAMGDVARSCRTLEQAMAAARALGDATHVRRCEATLGQAYAAASSYEEAFELLDRTVRAPYTLIGSGAAISYGYSQAIRGSVLGDRGEFEEAQLCFEGAIDAIAEVREEFVVGSVLMWRGAVYSFQGRWDDAREATQGALDVAERTKSLLHLGRGTTQMGHVEWQAKGDEAALRTIEQGTNWLEENSIRLFISLDHGWLAQGMLELADFDRVRRYAAMALRRARSGDRLGEAMACRAMARAALAGRARRSAQHYLAIADRSAAVRGSRRERALNTMCHAEVHMAHDRAEEAARLLEIARLELHAMEMDWHEVRVSRLASAT